MTRYVKPLVKYAINSQEVTFEFKLHITKLLDILYILDPTTLDPNNKYIQQMYIHCFQKDSKNPSLDLKLQVF